MVEQPMKILHHLQLDPTVPLVGDRSDARGSSAIPTVALDPVLKSDAEANGLSSSELEGGLELEGGMQFAANAGMRTVWICEVRLPCL